MGQVLADLNVMGKHPVQRLLAAQIQAGRGGHGDQHHGGEDTDVGKAHGVLLHPVQKAGHGDEVPGLVIKDLIGPQPLEHRHGPGGEEAIGAQHHQQHRHKEQQKGLQRVLYLQRDGIARPPGPKAPPPPAASWSWAPARPSRRRGAAGWAGTGRRRMQVPTAASEERARRRGTAVWHMPWTGSPQSQIGRADTGEPDGAPAKCQLAQSNAHQDAA